MKVPALTVEQGREIDRYLETSPKMFSLLVKFYSGVYLCKKCDVFTNEPEKHVHGVDLS